MSPGQKLDATSKPTQGKVFNRQNHWKIEWAALGDRVYLSAGVQLGMDDHLMGMVREIQIRQWWFDQSTDKESL